MFSPGRSVNLQDCSFPSYPPHILKNRRVSRRDTRFVSRSAYIYMCVYTSFSFDFFLRPFLRFSSVRISTPRRRREIRQQPNYHPSSLRLECYMLSRGNFSKARPEFTSRQTPRLLVRELNRKAKRRKESAVKKRTIHGGRVE